MILGKQSHCFDLPKMEVEKKPVLSTGSQLPNKLFEFFVTFRKNEAQKYTNLFKK